MLGTSLLPEISIADLLEEIWGGIQQVRSADLGD